MDEFDIRNIIPIIAIIGLILFSWLYNRQLNAAYKLTQNHDYAGALKIYNRALWITPRNLTVVVARAYLHGLMGKFDDAQREFQRAIQRDPKQDNSYYWYGEFYVYMLNDFVAARKQFLETLRVNPMHEKARQRLGHIAVQSKQNIAEAVEELTPAIEEIKLQLEKHDHFSPYLRSTDSDYQNEKRDLSQLYTLRAMLYQQLEQSAQAEADFQTAHQLDKNHSLSYQCAIYFLDKNYAAALEPLSILIEAEPDDQTYHNLRAASLYHLGDYQQAIADWDKLVQLDKQNASAYNDRGEGYFALGQYENAAADFEKALTLMPNLRNAKAGRALTHYVMGDIDQACAIWQNLIDHDKRYRDIDWVGKNLEWAEPLTNETRKLIDVCENWSNLPLDQHATLLQDKQN